MEHLASSHDKKKLAYQSLSKLLRLTACHRLCVVRWAVGDGRRRQASGQAMEPPRNLPVAHLCCAGAVLWALVQLPVYRSSTRYLLPAPHSSDLSSYYFTYPDRTLSLDNRAHVPTTKPYLRDISLCANTHFSTFKHKHTLP